MTKLLLSGVSALFLSACGGEPSAEQQAAAANQVAAAQAGVAPKPMSGFAAMDGDGDGALTQAEHTTAAGAMFAAMDTDNNGAVTAAEMDAAQAKIGGTSAMSSAEKIKAVDMNTDTIVSSAEHIAGAGAMFVKMDADRNGSLSQSEFDAGHATLMAN